MARATLLLSLCVGGTLLALCACSDNATRLSRSIELAATSPTGGDAADFLSIDYTPKRFPEVPYYLVFFPAHAVSEEDLVHAGAPPATAREIFSQLTYVGVGERPLLIVAQDRGRIHFTSHWKRYTSVHDLLVIRGSGTTTLTLERSEQGLVVLRSK
jgi:hypothetical protein